MIAGGVFSLSIDPASVGLIAGQVAGNIAERIGETTEIELHFGGKRGDARNRMIAEVQKKRGRNPFFLDKDAIATIKPMVGQLVNSYAGVRRMAARQIGEAMIDAIARNVGAQRGPGGRGFTPLSPEYAKRKRKQFGFIQPILKATGDLLGGLVVRVQRRRA